MLKERYHQIAVALFLVGVVLITTAEMSDRLGWTRVIGATLITLAALGIGVWIGLIKPGQWSVPSWIKSRRITLGLIGIFLLFLPVLLALAAGIISLVNGVEGTGWVYALGVLLLLFMTAVTVEAIVEGAGSIRTAGDLERESSGDDR